MLTVRKKGIFEDRYLIFREEKEIARLTTGVWPRKGNMEIEGTPFRFYRNGYFGGKFIAEKNGLPIAHALKPRMLKDHFVITVGNLNFEMSREERFGKGITTRWEDEEIGTIKEGEKKVHAVIDLPDSLGPELQIFFFWLTQILWDRHARAGAFGG